MSARPSDQNRSQTCIRWLGAALVLAVTSLRAQVPPASYRVETIETPEATTPEVTALDFAEDGTLVVAFRAGTLWRRPPSGKWTRFATGLLWPLGLLAGAPNECFVLQAPELTRIVDHDGDGSADEYETICDRWGLAGNYHEFVAGPVRDSQGNFFVALGCVSSGGDVRAPFRGQFVERGALKKRYGHWSPVPWRGWVLKIRPDGEVEPWACGFRQPNGIVLDANGGLFSVDNQGDWVASSPLYHVRRGGFYGHPASLVWRPGYRRDPAHANPVELERLRTTPAVILPQNDLAGSIAQPVFDTTEGAFGPYAGQLFIAEWAHPRILRVDLEEVDGKYQGAAFLFLEQSGLRAGNNRLAFAPDGSLWVGQISRVWGGTGEGLQRVVFTGETPFDLLRLRRAPGGFEATFTRAVDPETAGKTSAWTLRRYRYLYHAKYGSPKVDEAPVKLSAAEVAEDGLSIRLRTETLRAGFVYELRPRAVLARDGTALLTRLAAYTVH